MRFSWKGLLLAPLLFPALFSLVFVGPTVLGSLHGLEVLVPFLIVLVPGCVVSYGATVFLLLPSLYVLSQWRPLNWAGICLMGAVLGLLMFVPVTALVWKSSGPD
jgi:hypothetical protein